MLIILSTFRHIFVQTDFRLLHQRPSISMSCGDGHQFVLTFRRDVSNHMNE